MAGALVVAPVLILWGMDRPEGLTRARALELVLLLGFVLLVGWVVFVGPSSWTSGYPLTFLCILPLVMAAFRFGPREAATCVALLSGVAIWATLQGAGPFGRYTQDELLLLLGAFIGTIAVATPLLAALVKELARLAEIVRASEDGIVANVGKTPDGIITTWNAGAERLYGYAAHEVMGRPISILIPPERRDELAHSAPRCAQSHPQAYVFRRKFRRLLEQRRSFGEVPAGNGSIGAEDQLGDVHG